MPKLTVISYDLTSGKAHRFTPSPMSIHHIMADEEAIVAFGKTLHKTVLKFAGEDVGSATLYVSYPDLLELEEFASKDTFQELDESLNGFS